MSSQVLWLELPLLLLVWLEIEFPLEPVVQMAPAQELALWLVITPTLERLMEVALTPA